MTQRFRTGIAHVRRLYEDCRGCRQGSCQKETGPEKDDEIKEIQWNIAGYAQKLNTFGHTFFRSCFKFIEK